MGSETKNNNLKLIKKVCEEYDHHNTYCYALCKDYSNTIDKSKRWLVVMSKIPFSDKDDETMENPIKSVNNNSQELCDPDRLKIIKIIDIKDPYNEVKQIIGIHAIKYEVNETIKLCKNNKINYYSNIERAYYDRKRPPKYTGEWYEWYDDLLQDKKSSKEIYKNGRLDGRIINWHPNGKKKSDGVYKNGNLYGKNTEWYDSGEKYKEKCNNNGSRCGKIIRWYKNGQKQYEDENKGALANGSRTTWYDNGQKQAESSYVNGYKVGPYIEWHSNGKISFIGDCSKDKDISIAFHQNGKKHMVFYSHIECRDIKYEWNENGDSVNINANN